MGKHLDRAALCAVHVPFFVAYRLACYQREQGINDALLAATLGCETRALTRLRLCRMPQDASFPEDIRRIASCAHARPDELARILRSPPS